MIEVAVPRSPPLHLDHLALDVNGTLALDGRLLPGVAERLEKLGMLLNLHLITADTHGRQHEIDRELGLTAVRLDRDQPEAEQKAAFVRSLGDDSVVAIGNGANDALMLREAALGIAVLGSEGLAYAALAEADVVVREITDALDMLLNTRRLIATLRR
jgi:P-type E1-E2 ATPase